MLLTASYYFYLEQNSYIAILLYSIIMAIQVHSYRCTTSICCSYSPVQTWVWLLEPFTTPMLASYNFNISSCNCSESVLLPCIGFSNSILEKYYVHHKFCQCYNSNPQSNFIQHPRISFPNCKLWAHSGNWGKVASKENNLLYSFPIICVYLHCVM